MSNLKFALVVFLYSATVYASYGLNCPSEERAPASAHAEYSSIHLAELKL